jgi:hypothetical protein
MSVERDIRFDLIARLCPNTTGAELRSVATEVSRPASCCMYGAMLTERVQQAGMFAIRARRKMATEKDFLEAVEKVVRQGSKFSSTGLYAQVSGSSVWLVCVCCCCVLTGAVSRSTTELARWEGAAVLSSLACALCVCVHRRGFLSLHAACWPL